MLGIACLACAAQAAGPDDPAGVAADLLEQLVRHSPFIPPAGAAARGDAARGELELRGVVWDGSAYRFSIFDPATGESIWTALDEPGHPFRARSFDRERDALTVEYQGRVLVLSLAEAELSESAEGAAAPPAPAPLPTNGPARSGTGLNSGPAPDRGQDPAPPASSAASAQEAQRLQQLADEARRRRGVGPPPEPPKN